MLSKSDTDHPPAPLVFLWCLSGGLGVLLAGRAAEDWVGIALGGVVLMLLIALLLVVPVAVAWTLGEWIIEEAKAALGRDRPTRPGRAAASPTRCRAASRRRARRRRRRGADRAGRAATPRIGR